MEVTGKVRVLDRDRVPIVVALLPQEVADYYLWLAERETWVKFFRPKTQFHLTLVSARFDGKIYVQAAKKLDIKEVKVTLNLDTMRINKIRRLNAIGVYCNVFSKSALDFRRKCGIVKPKKNFGYHVTLGTTKPKRMTAWPKTTTITELPNGNIIKS